VAEAADALGRPGLSGRVWTNAWPDLLPDTGIAAASSLPGPGWHFVPCCDAQAAPGSAAAGRGRRQPALTGIRRGGAHGAGICGGVFSDLLGRSPTACRALVVLEAATAVARVWRRPTGEQPMVSKDCLK